jgi:tetratricopeptide (TPR) repeat protein
MDLRVATDIQQAAQLEQDGQLEEAAKLYEDAIKPKPADEHPYNRLMIIYRKLKRPKDELRVIKAGIAAFESQFVRKSRNKKLTELSNAMMRSAGLSDKKGKQLYHPEPINKWMKRKELVERKLEKDV